MKPLILSLLCLAWLGWAVPAFSQDPISKIVGPVTPMGTSPWPWYDKAEQGNADEILAAALANKPQLGPQAGGLFELIDGCGIQLKGPGVSEFQNGDWAAVAWDAPDGPGTGHFIFHNVTVAGDTMTASDRCGLSPGLKAGTGLKVYHCKVGCRDATATYNPGAWGLNAGWGINSWNYYDVALAVYRVYLRTGDVKYLTQFRDFADTWWLWALDQGTIGVAEPRNWSLVSQYVRALDGKPERLPALAAYMQTAMQWSWAAAVTPPTFDPRESGYLTLFLAVGARADADPTRRAWYCAALAPMVQQWISTQHPSGYWSEKNGGYAYRPPGTSPWRMFAATQALARAYEVFTDTTCSNPTLAVSTLATITKAVDYTYKAGRADNRGVYYDTDYANAGQEGTNAGLKPGQVSIPLGASAVTGIGTTFRTTFKCNGTDWIGIAHADGYTWTHQVQSCASDTQLTIVGTWGDHGAKTAASSAPYYHTPPAPTNCGSSIALTCWSGFPSVAGQPVPGDRNNARELIWAHGWLFNVTKNPIYQTRGDELFSASYGGPAGGPGDTGPCGGPACDGIVTDYHASIHGCAFGQILPCNVETNYPPPGNVFQYFGKRFGQGSGIGGAANYLAWRSGTVTPPTPPQPPDPCVVSPLSFRVNRWPAQPTGSRRFDYTSSVPATIVLNLRVSPWTATATNQGGCAVTETKKP